MAVFNYSMHGPRYALIGENVTYNLDAVELPPNVSPDEVVITWYKDGKIIKQYDWENQWTLNLYDIGYPAEGTYYSIALLNDGEFIARSNEIYLEIGTEYRQVHVTVTSRTIIEADIGDTINLKPKCIVQPSFAHYIMQWSRNNTDIGTEDGRCSIQINSDDDYGTYSLKTTAFAHGGFLDANKIDVLRIVPRGVIEETCPNIHIHELKPGRDAGYLELGYWVLDEIFQANKDGFDWQSDPFAPRFKYKCEIANLIEGYNKWPDLEVQESRHGYILKKSDMYRTNLDHLKGLTYKA